MENGRRLPQPDAAGFRRAAGGGALGVKDCERGDGTEGETPFGRGVGQRDPNDGTETRRARFYLLSRSRKGGSDASPRLQSLVSSRGARHVERAPLGPLPRMGSKETLKKLPN